MERHLLIALASDILLEGDPVRLGDLIERFDDHIPHPAASDLFLFPALEFGAGHRPTAFEIVDAALGYRDGSADQVVPHAFANRRRAI